MSTSIYGLLALLFRIDAAQLRERIANGAPLKAAGGFLVSIATTFVFLWGAMLVSSMASGEPFEDVLRFVVTIDCVVLLPLLAAGGIWLWRDEPRGHLLGGLLLVKAATTGLTLTFNTALSQWWG